MVKFVFKIFLFLIVFFILDKLFLIVTHYSAEAEVDKRLELVVTGQMEKDIIIAGSSRGSRDIIAKQLEDSLGLSAYNLCFPGSDVRFHEFLAKSLLNFNKPPKCVLLVVDDDQELTDDSAILFRKDRLYPLAKYEYIWEALAIEEGKNPFVSRFLVLDRLNKYNFDLRKKKFTELDSILNCGSMPISWYRDDWEYEYCVDNEYNIDDEVPSKVIAFLNMIKLIESSGSELVVVFPPNFKSHSIDFENRIKELSGDSVDFYVYNVSDSVYLRKESFFDESHLMKHSAKIFTNEITNYLRTKHDELLVE